MIGWRGLGGMTILIAAAAVTVIDWTSPSTWDHRWFVTAVLLVAAVVNYSLGRHLNSAPGRILIDSATGQRLSCRRRHDLYSIPMEYWSIAFLLAIAVTWLTQS
jgi:hypothetical protein